MDLESARAAELGFPKAAYTAVERERRWLCREVPRALVRQTLLIHDLYVAGTRLRLREMRPVDGGTAMLKLSRKADVDESTRLITTIYLPEEEFAILAATLSGARLTKIRHRLRSPEGVLLSVDEFQGELTGLVLAEAELPSAEALAAFPAPEFAVREVTDDHRFTGGWLVQHGMTALAP